MSGQGAVGLIPVDGRPVTYQFSQWLAAMAGIELLCPPVGLLGQLKQPADAHWLRQWIQAAVPQTTVMIASLDMLAYGGLIPSRVGHEKLDDLKPAIKALMTLFYGQPVLGFSSILRIPHYNNDEEEPAYWAQYGLRLAQYSSQCHQLGGEASTDGIPEVVLSDFLTRRRRNFEMNQYWLTLLEEGLLTTLTYCQDDTGAYGLNVQEAHALQTMIADRGLEPMAWVQTGADELAHTLLARYGVAFLNNHQPRVWVVPTDVYRYQTVVALFDGQPIEQVVSSRLAACGAVPAPCLEEADLVWVVHTPGGETQGDHCIDQSATVHPDQLKVALSAIDLARHHGLPVVIGDVAYANGADPLLMEALVSDTSQPLAWLYGYAGWNTPGNALGCALAMALLRQTAQRHNRLDEAMFARALSVRLLEDWGYQAVCRRTLKAAHPQEPDRDRLMLAMMPWEQRIATWLDWHPPQPWRYWYPCNRYFEIGIA